MIVVLRHLNGLQRIMGLVPKADIFTKEVHFPIQTTDGLVYVTARYVRRTTRIVYYQEGQSWG